MNDPYIGKLFLMDWHPPNPNVADNRSGVFLFMVVSKGLEHHSKDGYLCESLTSGRQYIYNEFEIISGLVQYKQWKEKNNV
jgi:hypothetical protein